VSDLVAAGLAGFLGLLVGSFVNVVVHRVPRGESVVSPASRCPSCGHPVAARDNVPVLSWLLLRGRCRHCRCAVGARYPLVELVTAAVFVVLALRLGATAQLPAFLYLGAAGVALALIDLDVKRLPNAIVLPSYPVALGLLLVPATLGAWSAYGRALLAMAGLFAAYFALALVQPGGMGFGDVKLAGLLGLHLGWLGWAELLVGALAGFVLGGAVGVALLLTRRATRRSAIPFGPFMLAGALVGVLAGDGLARLYLGLLVPAS
jgi:leader peptidase (prepilin peptidase)/N-methyltransferase